MERWRTATSGGFAGGLLGVLVALSIIEGGAPARAVVAAALGYGFTGAVAGAAMIGLDRIARALEGTPVTRRVTDTGAGNLAERFGPPPDSGVPPDSGPLGREESWPEA